MLRFSRAPAVLLCLWAANLCGLPAAWAAVIVLEPAETTIAVGGEATMVRIVAHEATSLQGFQLKLSFDPALIHIEDPALLNEVFDFQVRNLIDNVFGTGELAAAGFETLSGDVVLATLLITGVSEGTTPLTFSDVLLSDANAQPIPATVSGGIVTVSRCPSPRALVAESGAGRLVAVNLASGTVQTIHPPPGSSSSLSGPHGVVVAPDGLTAYVTETSTGELTAIDLLNGATRTIHPPPGGTSALSVPRGIAVNATGTSAYVAEAGSGQVTRIDLATGQAVTLVSGLSSPEGIVLAESGVFAYVTEASSGELSEVNILLRTVRSVHPPSGGVSALSGPQGLAFTDDENRLLISELNGELTSVELDTSAAVTVHPPAGSATSLSRPNGVFLNSSGSAAFVTEASSGEVSAVNLSTGAASLVAAGFSTPRGIAAAARLCPGFCLDLDADGFGFPGDETCSLGARTDCDDDDRNTYPGAAEVNDAQDNQCPGDRGYGAIDEISGPVGFSNPLDRNELSWPPQTDAASYDVARSFVATFAGACDRFATDEPRLSDPSIPAPGRVFHYLVGSLAPNTGSWGQDSTGVERSNVCP